ncbi:hypothetical protein M8J77_006948 [Diaphorina citri]|nr:hypothetical protein M8J77_006948 [Diaphorina citri]
MVTRVIRALDEVSTEEILNTEVSKLPNKELPDPFHSYSPSLKGISSQGLLGVLIILIQMNSAKFSTIIPERPKEELQVQCESEVLSSIYW